MRKKKNIQLSIFDAVDVSTEELFWLEFKKVVDKLKKEGFSSIDESWWRSRYSDHIEVPGNSPNKKGFEHQRKAAKSWPFIWLKHKTEISSNEIQ